MNLFCIIGFDAPNSAKKRQEHLEKHLVHLRALNQAEKLLVAGPLLINEEVNASEYGSLYIVDFENLEAAELWFKEDIYYQCGVYEKLLIKPYIDALPNC
jgi:uncharacterized protein YciI